MAHDYFVVAHLQVLQNTVFLFHVCCPAVFRQRPSASASVQVDSTADSSNNNFVLFGSSEDTLQHLGGETKVKRKERVQELSLKVQMEKNYVNRNAKQARELKDSNEKILALERTLQVPIVPSSPPRSGHQCFSTFFSPYTILVSCVCSLSWTFSMVTQCGTQERAVL